jgi:hypothetical protein
MRSTSEPKLCLLFAVSVLIHGCDDSKLRGISGKVYTDSELSRSIILSGDITENSYKPVVGADVLLTFDSSGLRIIAGSNVKTDSSGAYHINTTKLPPPTDPSGNYYLVVKKDGYETFVHAVRIGMMSSYQQNRVVLSQPIVDKQKRPHNP